MFDRSVNKTPNNANEEHVGNDSMLINITI